MTDAARRVGRPPTLPVEFPAFDHDRPAEFLVEQGGSYNPPGLDVSLDRFEKLAKDLNAMLAKP